MSSSEIMTFAKDQGVKMVDLKFSDLFGTWQHFSLPIHQLTDEVFQKGLNFDGSSLRAWQNIDNSDMTVIPDPATAKIDPFMELPTLSLICDIYEPDNGVPYSKDPRQIAKKAVEYLKSTGIADTAFFGPEAEFFIFDDIRYSSSPHYSFYEIDSEEAIWNSGGRENKNLGHLPRHKGGYFPALPTDRLHDLRAEMCMVLEQLGIQVERQHHEVATAGQGEINIRYDELLPMADTMMWFKYVIKNVARRHHKTATFMPKPIFNDNGSGMHTHMSLFKEGKALFAGNEYAGLSETALHFIGGILKHAPSVCAFTNPTTNSYKRLVPGFEAPIRLAYSARNRSASIRIPMTGDNPKAKRIEFRTPDPSANVYLAFSALLMAGIDGIQNKIHPGEPLEKDLYSLSHEEGSKVESVPSGLEESLKNLATKNEFLLAGDVFTKDFLYNWINYKTENEVREIQARPLPIEFHMYYDI